MKNIVYKQFVIALTLITGFTLNIVQPAGRTFDTQFVNGKLVRRPLTPQDEPGETKRASAPSIPAASDRKITGHKRPASASNGDDDNSSAKRARDKTREIEHTLLNIKNISVLLESDILALHGPGQSLLSIAHTLTTVHDYFSSMYTKKEELLGDHDHKLMNLKEIDTLYNEVKKQVVTLAKLLQDIKIKKITNQSDPIQARTSKTIKSIEELLTSRMSMSLEDLVAQTSPETAAPAETKAPAPSAPAQDLDDTDDSNLAKALAASVSDAVKNDLEKTVLELELDDAGFAKAIANSISDTVIKTVQQAGVDASKPIKITVTADLQKARE